MNTIKPFWCNSDDLQILSQLTCKYCRQAEDVYFSDALSVLHERVVGVVLRIHLQAEGTLSDTIHCEGLKNSRPREWRKKKNT